MNNVTEEELKFSLRQYLEESYMAAERLVSEDRIQELETVLGKELYEAVSALAKTNHAGRGVVLTLSIYKKICPSQDIRAHKAEMPSGFSARRIDTDVTVPWLRSRELPTNVETHWLTQTFSFAPYLATDVVLKTQPRKIGPLVVQVVNCIQDRWTEGRNDAMIQTMLARLIEERNRNNVSLTIPKGMQISQLLRFLKLHFSKTYSKNAPRLPQCAIYAMYQCLISEVSRYKDMELKPLGRMKSADRKSGSVGDIEVFQHGVPTEAVEVKLGIEISTCHITEMCEKIKSHTVKRYYVLSTVGINADDKDEIAKMKDVFFRRNGCEIIINGVYETLGYYLRLLPAQELFVAAYVNLLNEDPDVGYEHKSAWNDICDTQL